MESIAIYYDHSDEDVQALARHLAIYSSEYRRARDAVVGWILAATIVLACIVFYAGEPPDRAAVAAGLIAISGAIYAWRYHKNYPRRVAENASALYKREPKPCMFGQNTLVFDESGVKGENVHARAEYRWSAFPKFTETSTHLFLFIGPLEAITLAKGRLGDDTLAIVRRLISERVPPVV